MDCMGQYSDAVTINVQQFELESIDRGAIKSLIYRTSAKCCYSFMHLQTRPCFCQKSLVY